MLAMQYQLELSQWWSPDALMQRQLEQLSRLFYLTYKTIPFYKARLDTAGYRPGQDLTLEIFRRLPLLRRSEIQEHGEALRNSSPPRDHGGLLEHTTSGSTGRPIRAWWTELTQFFWYALTLREHLWHKRDFTAKLAVIRSKIQDGMHDGWGPSTDVAFRTGKAAALNIGTDIRTQLSWLRDQAPAYLLSHPSNVLELARLSKSVGIVIPSLRQIRTFGETLSADCRAACSAAWGVSVADSYSSEEVGYMALQCPEREHYHVQSETVVLEVLDDEGEPCRAGETGRVVVTTLHNFAMPLIRYEILDYAEVGPPCTCGRGLPVLSRIVGRQRNLVTLPDGRRFWPSLPTSEWMRIGTIRQMQLVQKSAELIEVRLACSTPLTVDQETELATFIQGRLGYPFKLAFTYLAEIERKANHKFEDFVSELPSP